MCEGTGHDACCISELNQESLEHHANGDQLVELRNDAIRLKKQAAELSKLNPRHAKEYSSQLDAALMAVNESANELLK